jgi:hypothetical protein
MKLTTVSDVPVTIALVGDCLLHVDTAPGTQPTIRLDASLNVSPENFRINQVSNATVTGLETSDVSLGGGFGCQLANLGLGFYIDLLEDQLVPLLLPQGRLCRFCDSTLGECTYFDLCGGATDCDSGVCQSAIAGSSRCAAFSHCGNGTQDEGELHVDCGGMSNGSGCFGCATGQSCVDGLDCLSSLCTGGMCQ